MTDVHPFTSLRSGETVRRHHLAKALGESYTVSTPPTCVHSWDRTPCHCMLLVSSLLPELQQVCPVLGGSCCVAQDYSIQKLKEIPAYPATKPAVILEVSHPAVPLVKHGEHSNTRHQSACLDQWSQRQHVAWDQLGIKLSFLSCCSGAVYSMWLLPALLRPTVFLAQLRSDLLTIVVRSRGN